MSDSSRLAVLIDADNAQPSKVHALLAEIATYGTAHVKRAYGDWTGTALRHWKDHLLAQSIQPIQQFAYTTGKNATDSAMIIDAMDLLYSGRFDGFCIVSSDSDFTRLASRLRESGLTVYGFGARKTPQPFVAACDKFTYLENLPDPAAPSDPAPPSDRSDPAEVDERSVAPGGAPAPVTPSTHDVHRADGPVPSARLRGDSALVTLLRGAVEAASDDEGWATLGAVGQILVKQRPDFDPRTWGYRKLSDLVETTGLFDLAHRDDRAGVIYARDRRSRRG